MHYLILQQLRDFLCQVTDGLHSQRNKDSMRISHQRSVKKSLCFISLLSRNSVQATALFSLIHMKAL